MTSHVVRLTKIQIDRVKAAVKDVDPDDFELLSDMLEGETDLYKVCAELIRAIEDEEGIQAALTEQINSRKFRKSAAGKRADDLKRGLFDLMEFSGQSKIPLPEATISLRTNKPKIRVSNAMALPDGFYTIEEKRIPDMERIKQLETPVAGTEKTNGSKSLVIRRG